MGAAEVGRELGNASGPILVAAAASGATLPGDLLALAGLLAAAGAAISHARQPSQRPRRCMPATPLTPRRGRSLAGTRTAPG
jgi:hypothetical protein